MLTSTPTSVAVNSTVSDYTDTHRHTDYTDTDIGFGSSLEDPFLPYASDTDVFDPDTTISTSIGSSVENVSGREERAMLQATVFVEDALEHRSIHHKIDTKSIIRYRLYHSKPVRWLLRVTISLLLALAFFESPSSLTISSL